MAAQVDVSRSLGEAQKWLDWCLHSHPFSQTSVTYQQMLVIILQLLSNFIPVYLPVFLSMYIFVRRFFCRCKRQQRPGDRLPPGAYGRTAVCVIYFPAHCAGVTNVSSHYNLSPLWRHIASPTSKYEIYSCASQKGYQLCWKRVRNVGNEWKVSSQVLITCFAYNRAP